MVAPADSNYCGDPTIGPEPLVLGKDETTPSLGWTKPELGFTYLDPSYGTRLTRVTSAGDDRFNRNPYSRRQTENSDGSLFLTYHGSAQYHVYEVCTNELVAELEIHPDGEPQWHSRNPTILRHTTGSNSSVGSLRVQETDVIAGTTETVADLTGRVTRLVPTAKYLSDWAEGSPSGDGNRYAWMVFNQLDQPIGIVSYDLASDTILGVIDLDTSAEVPLIDWVSMSASGEYVVVSGESGTYVYDADLSDRRLVTEASDHADLGYDIDGDDAYIYADFSVTSETSGWLVSVDLETLERTKVFDIYDDGNSSIHVSAKSYDRPGWALVSTYNCKVEGAWTCNKVFAVELVSEGQIVNLAHTYNCGNQYWTETHAVVNRDFSRVYFNSDSGSCGQDAEVFRIDVPSF